MESVTDFSESFLINNAKIEVARKTDFSRLSDTTYLDHAGATLYSDLHLTNLFADLSSNIYGNPHSRNSSSQRSTDVIRDVRQTILRHFNTNSEDYSVIFVSNCTSALYLVARSFTFSNVLENNSVSKCSEDKNRNVGLLAYIEDNHTSVVGMRNVVAEQGCDFRCLTRQDIEDSLCPPESVEKIGLKDDMDVNNLFVYPAQSNFSGERYPLSWIEIVQSRTRLFGQPGEWFVFLDAASLLTTSVLDLNTYKPDFVGLSFYKMFGYPTGLGCLLVKNSSQHLLRKSYFGGGTVEVYFTGENFHVPRKNFCERFEDGTLPFLEIVAVKHGFNLLHAIPGSIQSISEHTFLLARHVYKNLLKFRYSNGSPLAILYHSTDFESEVTQGPIVNFNLLNPDGTYIGYAQVEKLASLYNIDLRTGCFCNMGACRKYLKLSYQKIKENFQAGHVCGDDLDLIDGLPTGSVRISFGFSSTLGDAETFLSFVRDCFLRNKMRCFNEAKSSLIPENGRTDSRTTQHCDKFPVAENGAIEHHLSLSEIRVYPVKSCGAMSLRRCQVGQRGLLYDREWMIVNESGSFMSQKRVPNLCHIMPSIHDNHLILNCEGFPSHSLDLTVQINTPSSVQLCRSNVCRDKVESLDCGDEVAAWLESVLATPGVRLVRQCSNDERVCSRKTELSTDPARLSLANESQFLLIGTASLQAVLETMQRLASPKDETDPIIDSQELVERFRPNLIVQTMEPFEEELWSTVQIGNKTFLSEGRCNRCQMICINQKTCMKSKEPLRTLATMPGRKSTFGILLRQINSGGGVQGKHSRHFSECEPGVLSAPGVPSSPEMSSALGVLSHDSNKDVPEVLSYLSVGDTVVVQSFLT